MYGTFWNLVLISLKLKWMTILDLTCLIYIVYTPWKHTMLVRLLCHSASLCDWVYVCEKDRQRETKKMVCLCSCVFLCLGRMYVWRVTAKRWQNKICNLIANIWLMKPALWSTACRIPLNSYSCMLPSLKIFPEPFFFKVPYMVMERIEWRT